MATEDFNTILNQIGAGENTSPRLMEALYAELRAIAERLMQRERGGHTLQPTALVHEAFLRLVESEKVGTRGHLHFLGAAAVTMRRVLVDHARGVHTQKRGGGSSRQRITLSGIVDDRAGVEPVGDVDITALDEALAELGKLDPRHEQIVVLRFFGGMSGEQIAEQLGISRSTVVRDLAFARAWLRRRMRA